MSKTVMMIHGMQGGGWYWKGYRIFFESQGYRCVTPTLRYHDIFPNDQPDPALGKVSLLDYADDLERELQKLPKDTVIIGHSMGGLLAQILAARGYGSKIVLIAPAAPYGIFSFTPSVLKGFLSILRIWKFWEKPIKQSFEESKHSVFNLIPEALAREYYQKGVYESGRAAFEIGLWPLDKKRASFVDASKVKAPMLIVVGEEDNITPVVTVKKVAAKYPQAELKIYQNYAHWIIAEEAWEKVLADIYEWIENN